MKLSNWVKRELKQVAKDAAEVKGDREAEGEPQGRSNALIEFERIIRDAGLGDVEVDSKIVCKPTY